MAKGALEFASQSVVELENKESRRAAMVEKVALHFGPREADIASESFTGCVARTQTQIKQRSLLSLCCDCLGRHDWGAGSTELSTLEHGHRLSRWLVVATLTRGALEKQGATDS